MKRPRDTLRSVFISQEGGDGGGIFKTDHEYDGSKTPCFGPEDLKDNGARHAYPALPFYPPLGLLATGLVLTCGSELQFLSVSSCSKSLRHGRSTHSRDGDSDHPFPFPFGASESRASRNMPPAVGKWAASAVTDTAVRSPTDGEDEEEEEEDVPAAAAAVVAAAGAEVPASPFDEESPRLLSPPPPSFRLKRVAAHTASCSRR